MTVSINQVLVRLMQQKQTVFMLRPHVQNILIYQNVLMQHKMVIVKFLIIYVFKNNVIMLHKQ